jgi:hypothetical protein
MSHHPTSSHLPTNPHGTANANRYHHHHHHPDTRQAAMPRNSNHAITPHGGSSYSQHAPATHHPHIRTHQPTPAITTTTLPPPLALLATSTTSTPLTRAQILALSDEAGSLRELVLLALGAGAGEPGCVARLVRAVGEEGAQAVVEFWGDEWVVE